MAEHEAGVPIWADVACPDLEKGIAFYKGLFGWEGEMGPPEYGGYTIFTMNGKMVAGAGPLMDPNQPPAWSGYMKTNDAAATAEKVKEAGGTVVMGPMQVSEQGSMLVCQDPTGSFFSAWQPGQHQGAEVFNQIGAQTWNELYTRDLATAVEFYKSVFGYGIQEADMPPVGKYTMFTVGDRPIAGALDMANIEIPADVPPHWLTYFQVADMTRSLTKIGELGGKSLAGPMDTPMGPFSVVQDPGGAVFALIEMKPQV